AFRGNDGAATLEPSHAAVARDDAMLLQVRLGAPAGAGFSLRPARGPILFVDVLQQPFEPVRRRVVVTEDPHECRVDVELAGLQVPVPDANAARAGRERIALAAEQHLGVSA